MYPMKANPRLPDQVGTTAPTVLGRLTIIDERLVSLGERLQSVLEPYLSQIDESASDGRKEQPRVFASLVHDRLCCIENRLDALDDLVSSVVP